jgi:hypothetical protein
VGSDEIDKIDKIDKIDEKDKMDKCASHDKKGRGHMQLTINN